MSDKQEQFRLVWLLVVMLFALPVVITLTLGDRAPEYAINMLQEVAMFLLGALVGMAG